MQGGVRLKVALFVASLVVAAALLTILLLPSLLDANTLRKQVTAQLAAWTGGAVSISGPARVSYFPNITFEADNVHIGSPAHLAMVRDVRAKTMRLELSSWSALFGTAEISRLALIEPQLELASQGAESSAASQLLSAIEATPVSRLSLKGAILHISGDGPETIKDVNTELDLASTGTLSGHGRFIWRDHPLTFSFDTSTPFWEGETAEARLDLSVSGPIVDAALEGQVILADGVQVQGSLELTIPRLRDFGVWTGISIPDGKGLGEFKAAGTFNWTEGRILFDEGDFSLDGNTAQGTLALDMGEPRPTLAGTLALQRFALAPYLTPAPPATAPAPSAGTQPVIDATLLRLIDLDLRLSTAEVIGAPVSLGETALSIRLKDGVLAADFSVLAICNGKTDGRLEVKADSGLPKLRLAATAAEVTAKPCLEAFAVAPSPIDGLTTVAVDLNGTGDEGTAILASLQGNVKLTLAKGQAEIDFVKMFTLAKQGKLRGWDAVRGKPTKFDSLAGHCKLLRGLAHCASMKLATGVADVTGEGSLDLVSGKLDWRLRVSNDVAERLPQVGRLLSSVFEGVVVEGPWTDPIFHLPSTDSGSIVDSQHQFASMQQRF